jgi:hypothetical protein
MDFKSLISKLDSMEAPPKVAPVPELPKAVQLNEDAQLRVLSGRTTYVAEAKKKADEDVKEEMKVGDKKNIATGTVEKTKTGIVHKSNKAYGGSEEKADDKDDEPKAKKKKTKESIDAEAFKGKFTKMVEAKKEEKPKSKKEKKVDEAAKPDFLDMDKDGNKKEPMKKAVADKKKKTVKESVEPKLSFKEMVKLVQESGGQQQIDPVDKALFNWAQRVAASKFNESAKAEIFAGLIYERNGGVFEMYDVLAEDQK